MISTVAALPKGRETVSQKGIRLTALAALLCTVVRRRAERNAGTGSDRGLGSVARVEGLARYDAVDLCGKAGHVST